MTREYKDSGIEWIGQIPKEWKIGKVKNYYSLQTGFTPDTKNELYYDDNGALWVNISDMGDSHYICNTKKKISDYYISKFKPTIVPKGSLLYSFKLSVGTVAIAGEEMYTNEAIATFLQKDGINLSFLYYSSQVCIIFNANENIYGAKLLNQDLINNATIIFPPLAEQQKIADYLDKVCGEVDEMVTLQETMIEELKAYKQSVITEAVTKGLNPNAPMRDSGIDWIGEIPEHWEVQPFKWILRKPLQYGANESGVLYDDSLPRYVRITDILNNSLREDLQKQSLTDEQAEGYILEDDDILFARSGGTVGKAFIYKKEYGRCAFAGYLIRAQIKAHCCPNYVYYYTQSQSYDEWKRQIFIQATIQNIGADRYSLMELPVPPLSEQRTIASYLDTKCSEIDALIALKQAKIEELKEYKKSVIYEYVTGKKEVI